MFYPLAPNQTPTEVRKIYSPSLLPVGVHGKLIRLIIIGLAFLLFVEWKSPDMYKGYHVDCLPPRMDVSNDFGVSTYVAFLNRTTNCVIDSINAEAKKYFELVRVNKVTTARRDIYLLTLTIKDEGNAGKIIQAEVSLHEEKQLLVCSCCGRQRCPILL